MQKLRGAPLPTTEMRRLLFTQQALIPSDKICCTILAVRLHPEYDIDTSQSRLPITDLRIIPAPTVEIGAQQIPAIVIEFLSTIRNCRV
jgi:hypothetical protein